MRPNELPPDIRRLRMGIGLTQQQFAERLHVTPLTVLRWESGRSSPRPLALARLRELEEEASTASATTRQRPTPKVPAAAPPLDFASEISRIDPLPHQRIAVYEHMLPQEMRTLFRLSFRIVTGSDVAPATPFAARVATW